jgi:hypothetical protein
MTTLYSCAKCGVNMEEVEGRQVCIPCLRHEDPLQRRINQARMLKQRLPVLGHKWAQYILEQVLQGDGVADDIEELLMDVEGEDGLEESYPLFESVDVNDHYTDLVWGAILSELPRRIDAEYKRKGNP